LQVTQVGENLYCLPGTAGSNTYLLDDTKRVLVDSGAEHSREVIRKAWLRAGFPLESIDILIQTHVHADHCGNSAWLRNNNPHMQIMGSRYKRTFEDLVDSIDLEFSTLEKSPESFSYDRELEHGDSLSAGNNSLIFYETPGHTVDSISVYLPGQSLLISGDAVYKGVVTQLFYYQPISISIASQGETLRFLETLDLERICTGHGPFIDEPRKVLRSSIKKLERFAANPELAFVNNLIPLVEVSLNRHGTVPRDSLEEYFTRNLMGKDELFEMVITEEKCRSMIEKAFTLMLYMGMISETEAGLHLSRERNAHLGN
jgi:hydroxyacylglutathione hydrolase